MDVIRIEPTVDVFSLPEGEYEGFQSGYSVAVEIDGGTYTLTTDVGMRGLNIPVKVFVEKGQLFVFAIT